MDRKNSVMVSNKQIKTKRHFPADWKKFLRPIVSITAERIGS